MSNLALIVPVYNEYSRWNYSYWSKLAEIDNVTLVFVNDGSTDESKKLLENFIATYDRCILINLNVNVGKAEAIRNGMIWAASREYGFIGFLDADGAFDVDEVRSIISSTVNELSVFGSPNSIWTSRVKLLGSNIHRRTSRHYIGRVMHTIIGLWIKNLPYDSQCGFKLFELNSDLSQSIKKPFTTKWFVDLEILARLRSSNPDYKVTEVPIQNWFDIPNSKLGIKSVLYVLKDLVMLIRGSRAISSKR